MFFEFVVERFNFSFIGKSVCFFGDNERMDNCVDDYDCIVNNGK